MELQGSRWRTRFAHFSDDFGGRQHETVTYKEACPRNIGALRVTVARLNTWVQRHRVTLFVFAGASAWFLPGLWWGLPINSATERMSGWGADELGPWGAVDAVLAIVRHPRNQITPQYPLAQFLVQAIFVWPYYLPYYLATLYPSVVDKIGLSLPQPSPIVLMLLHRLPSLLMAAGTVAIAYSAARRMAGNAAGWMAAAAVATIGPLLYYARTSNTDVGALFWTALAVLFALPALREGLTARYAIAVGVCAGIGTATKDQQYAFFLGLGVVLFTTHLLDRRRSGDWRGWWRGPIAGVGAATVTYLTLSGIVLLPQWFAVHVRFITRVPDVPEQLLALAGFRYGTPATLAGYLQLASNAGAQLVAALGLPILALALVGIVYTARSDRRLLCLLIVPALCLALGVIAPVRLVLPRFLLPVEFVLCLFAGLAVAAGNKMTSPMRAGVRIVAVVGILWAGLRGADLTYQMLHDSRYEAGAWLERNVLHGDIVAYYGAPVKLPRLPAHAVVTPATGQMSYAYERRSPTTLAPPTFIVSIPQLITEPVHEWTVPDSTFRSLYDGSSGYREVLAIQTAALWPRPLLLDSFVNPPVRIFARNEIVPRLRGPVRIELPDLR